MALISGVISASPMVRMANSMSGHCGDLHPPGTTAQALQWRGVDPTKKSLLPPTPITRGLFGGHEAVWMICQARRWRRPQPPQGDAHRVGKVESCGGHDFLDEMRQHLGVGVAGQRVPTVREELECLVVLNDAVVNDRDFPWPPMRVGVSVAWGPCRPTVCPMPTVPTGMFSATWASRLATLPSFFSTRSSPPSSGTHAVVPRYSSRVSPSIISGRSAEAPNSQRFRTWCCRS